MKSGIQLSFQEVAKILADHFCTKGDFKPNTKVDLHWHLDHITLQRCYVVLTQDEEVK